MTTTAPLANHTRVRVAKSTEKLTPSRRLLDGVFTIVGAERIGAEWIYEIAHEGTTGKTTKVRGRYVVRLEDILKK